MCVPYEKTISGRLDNKIARSMGFDYAPDPVGQYFKIGQFKQQTNVRPATSPQGRPLALIQQQQNLPRIANR